MTASIAPVYRFGRAEVRPCSRHLATVVSVRGEVTAEHLDALSTHVQRFVLPDTAFVLDLGDVHRLAPEGTSMLAAVDDACTVVGIEWALVTGPAVTAVLDEATRDRLLPVVDSIADALHDFADALTAQRRLLLPLLQRSA